MSNLPNNSADARRRSISKLLDGSAAHSPEYLYDESPADSLVQDRPASTILPTQNAEVKGNKTADLYKIYTATKSPDDMNKLMSALHPTMTSAISAAGSFVSQKTLLLAKARAVDAVNSYDPAAGASLETWLYHQLSPLKRDIRQGASGVKTSDSRVQTKYRVDSMATELEDKLGRPATSHEIADKLHISPRLVEKYQSFNYDVAADPESDIFDNIVSQDSEERIRRVVYDVMYESAANPDDKLVLDKLLKQEPKSGAVSDLANRLGVSVAAISKRRKKLEAKMTAITQKLRTQNA